MATLRRVSGNEVLQRYRITEGLVILGRDDTCDIVLTGPGISRRHCMLVLTSEGYCLEDLNSSNGTMIGGVRLGAKQLLKDNDRFTIMHHILEFRSADEETGEPQGGPSAPGELPAPSEEYGPTKKMDLAELSKRLKELLKDLKPSSDDR